MSVSAFYFHTLYCRIYFAVSILPYLFCGVISLSNDRYVSTFSFLSSLLLFSDITASRCRPVLFTVTVIIVVAYHLLFSPV